MGMTLGGRREDGDDSGRWGGRMGMTPGGGEGGWG